MEFEKLTIQHATTLLQNKEASAEQLARESVARTKELNEKLNSFITITEEEATAQAARADKDLLAEDHKSTRVAGIPYAAKDIFCTKGIRTTAGSQILKDYVPPYNATAVQKLEDAFAVLVGKNNCDEFAQGGSNENSSFGPVKNPWDLTRVSGGSSGGGAAAVASGQVVYALGSDTGGSIRLPASFCGIVGLKPTYGRVSRYGVTAMASSMDHMGPITKTVGDAAIALGHIAGHDKNDATTPKEIVPNYFDSLDPEKIKGKKLGVWKEWTTLPGVQPEVKEAFAAAVKHLESLGAKVTEVSLPHAEYAVPVYYILMPSEVSSNMARYDGIRYGHTSDQAKTLQEVYEKSRSEGFGPEVKRRIMLGTYALSAGYCDAYYKKAQRVRTIIRQEFEKAFQNVDGILSPTSPGTAFALGEKANDPVAMYTVDVLTAPANIAGIPAISIPCGFSKDPKLPIGLQMMGPQWGEQGILDMASAYEQSTDWHKGAPPL